jgi:hypothetical protein
MTNDAKQARCLAKWLPLAKIHCAIPLSAFWENPQKGTRAVSRTVYCADCKSLIISDDRITDEHYYINSLEKLSSLSFDELRLLADHGAHMSPMFFISNIDSLKNISFDGDDFGIDCYPKSVRKTTKTERRAIKARLETAGRKRVREEAC